MYAYAKDAAWQPLLKTYAWVRTVKSTKAVCWWGWLYYKNTAVAEMESFKETSVDKANKRKKSK